VAAAHQDVALLYDKGADSGWIGGWDFLLVHVTDDKTSTIPVEQIAHHIKTTEEEEEE